MCQSLRPISAPIKCAISKNIIDFKRRYLPATAACPQALACWLSLGCGVPHAVSKMDAMAKVRMRFLHKAAPPNQKIWPHRTGSSFSGGNETAPTMPIGVFRLC